MSQRTLYLIDLRDTDGMTEMDQFILKQRVTVNDCIDGIGLCPLEIGSPPPPPSHYLGIFSLHFMSRPFLIFLKNMNVIIINMLMTLKFLKVHPTTLMLCQPFKPVLTRMNINKLKLNLDKTEVITETGKDIVLKELQKHIKVGLFLNFYV